MRRWLVLGLALALAAMAGRALLRFQDFRGGSPPPERSVPEPPRAHDEIDEESRQRLLEILRQEDEP